MEWFWKLCFVESKWRQVISMYSTVYVWVKACSIQLQNQSNNYPPNSSCCYIYIRVHLHLHQLENSCYISVMNVHGSQLLACPRNYYIHSRKVPFIDMILFWTFFWYMLSLQRAAWTMSLLWWNFATKNCISNLFFRTPRLSIDFLY